jgi:hypothetical protein
MVIWLLYAPAQEQNRSLDIWACPLAQKQQLHGKMDEQVSTVFVKGSSILVINSE